MVQPKQYKAASLIEAERAEMAYNAFQQFHNLLQFTSGEEEYLREGICLYNGNYLVYNQDLWEQAAEFLGEDQIITSIYPPEELDLTSFCWALGAIEEPERVTHLKVSRMEMKLAEFFPNLVELTVLEELYNERQLFENLDKLEHIHIGESTRHRKVRPDYNKFLSLCGYTDLTKAARDIENACGVKHLKVTRISEAEAEALAEVLKRVQKLTVTDQEIPDTSFLTKHFKKLNKWDIQTSR